MNHTVRRAALGFLVLSVLSDYGAKCQTIAGFKPTGSFSEQQLYIENNPPGTRILINAPMDLISSGRDVLLVFYPLPNGNTIEQTFGKKTGVEDDWHFNIQHIGAQTRFLRSHIKNKTVVLVYLQAMSRSWPQWVAGNENAIQDIRHTVDRIRNMFAGWNPEVYLNGHSGGGRFVFSFIDSSDDLPQWVSSISFPDSNYGYEDSTAGLKIRSWLKNNHDARLCVLAYNDSIVKYNGKPLVSPTGGTWYKSKKMLDFLSSEFSFTGRSLKRDTIVEFSAEQRRILFLLKENPRGKIYHTVQVEKNGFIHSVLHSTRQEDKKYRYFGKRAYEKYISDSVILPIRALNIFSAGPYTESGSEFIARIDTLGLADREEAIFRAAVSGNVPSFLRTTVTVSRELTDSAGNSHQVGFEVMPDYLAIGNDSDFCRMPMNPITAQRIADVWGASLITPKMSDIIYSEAIFKLVPFNYIPVGRINEGVRRYADHNMQIEWQLRVAGAVRGALVAGIKKDIVLSEQISAKPDRVVIYGWHKPGGIQIQPVYSGHVWWYVDYSHGVRFVNNQVLIDGKPGLLSDILKDPVMFKMFSNGKDPISVAYGPIR